MHADPGSRPILPTEAAKLRSWSTFRTISAFILREMSTRYGRSPGGYLWAILEPIGMILIMTVAFSLLLRTPPLGTSFILFYATGHLPFGCYQSIQNATARAIGFSKALLFYPGVTWMDAVIARFLLNFLTSTFVAFLILIGIMVFADTQTIVRVGYAAEAFGLAALLGLGIGTLNCYLLLRITVWDIAWSIVTRPLFLASGILYLYEDLPPLARDFLWYNPLVHITSLARKAFFPAYRGDFISQGYVIAFALVPLVIGLMLLRRYQKDLVNEL